MTGDELSVRPTGLARRCGMAAVVGLGLGIAWLSLGYLIGSGVICSNRGWSCLGFALVGYYATPVLSVLLGWPLLRWAGVRPAWPVALTAPIAMWGLHSLLRITIGLSLPGLVAVVAAGYGVAALATAPRLRWPWRASVAVAVVALIPLATLADTLRVASATKDRLVAYGHPLFGPDLPGYRIQVADATSGTDPHFYYRLRARDRQTQDSSMLAVEIEVTQRTTPPRFNPPTDCWSEPTQPSVPPHSCVPIAKDAWKISDSRVYIVRRGDQVLTFRPGREIPESDVLDAVSSLRERSPDYFT